MTIELTNLPFQMRYEIYQDDWGTVLIFCGKLRFDIPKGTFTWNSQKTHSK